MELPPNLCPRPSELGKTLSDRGLYAHSKGDLVIGEAWTIIEGRRRTDLRLFVLEFSHSTARIGKC